MKSHRAARIKTARVGMAGAIAIVATLSGCSGAAEIEPLQRPQAPGDELPGAVEEAINPKPESSRLLVEDNGISYYVAVSDDSAEMCFASYRNDEEWASACTKALPVELEFINAPKAMLTADERHEEDGWISLGNHVSIHTDDRD